jgi:hypothetical protein
MKRFLLLFITCLLAAGQAAAQQSPDRDAGSTAGASGEAGVEVSREYEPYEDDEFPEWMHSVRRAEVVFFGAFPITLLFSSLAYDGYKSIRQVVTTGTVTGTSGAEIGQFNSDERLGIFIAGAGLAAAVSLIDFFIIRNEASSDD